MRKLVIAAKAKAAEKQSQEQRDQVFPPVPYEMDDGRVITFHMPETEHLVLMLSTLQEVGIHTVEGELVARDRGAAVEAGLGLSAFLHRMLIENDDHSYVMRRIRAVNDPLEMQHMMDAVMEIMQEEWTDRPSEPSSPSSSSRTRSGRRSTGTSPDAESTPSTSGSTGS